MNEAARFSRAPAVLWRRVGDEVLVAGSDGSDVDRLSMTASAAWMLLEAPRTRRDLTTALAAEFVAPAEDIADHVDHLINVLEQRGWAIRSVEDA